MISQGLIGWRAAREDAPKYLARRRKFDFAGTLQRYKARFESRGNGHSKFEWPLVSAILKKPGRRNRKRRRHASKERGRRRLSATRRAERTKFGVRSFLLTAQISGKHRQANTRRNRRNWATQRQKRDENPKFISPKLHRFEILDAR